VGSGCHGVALIEGLMKHANLRLIAAARLTLVGRIAAQPRRPIAHIAHEMGISRITLPLVDPVPAAG
jgi:hypothetical protein